MKCSHVSTFPPCVQFQFWAMSTTSAPPSPPPPSTRISSSIYVFIIQKFVSKNQDQNKLSQNLPPKIVFPESKVRLVQGEEKAAQRVWPGNFDKRKMSEQLREYIIVSICDKWNVTVKMKIVVTCSRPGQLSWKSRHTGPDYLENIVCWDRWTQCFGSYFLFCLFGTYFLPTMWQQVEKCT